MIIAALRRVLRHDREVSAPHGVRAASKQRHRQLHVVLRVVHQHIYRSAHDLLLHQRLPREQRASARAGLLLAHRAAHLLHLQAAILHGVQQLAAQPRDVHVPAHRLDAVQPQRGGEVAQHVAHELEEPVEEPPVATGRLELLARDLQVEAVVALHELHADRLPLLRRERLLDLLSLQFQAVRDRFRRRQLHVLLLAQLPLHQRAQRLVERVAAQEAARRFEHFHAVLGVRREHWKHVEEPDDRDRRAVATHVAEENRAALRGELVVLGLAVAVVQRYRDALAKKTGLAEMGEGQRDFETTDVRFGVVLGDLRGMTRSEKEENTAMTTWREVVRTSESLKGYVVKVMSSLRRKR